MGVWHVTGPDGTRHDITCLAIWQDPWVRNCQHGIWMHPDDADVQQSVAVLTAALDQLDPDNRLGRPEEGSPGDGLITWEFGPDAGRLLADWLEHARYGHMNQQRRLAEEAAEQ